MLGRIQTIGSQLLSKGEVLSTKFIGKTNALMQKSMYYGKVGAELSKTVYKQEGFQPPKIGEFKKVYCNIFEMGKHYMNKPQAFIGLVKGAGKNDLIKFGAYGVQLLGFYSVGEVIGRRKIVGYRTT
ncbi:F1F0 ATP synthase subunit g NDAI_0G03540 [Naumovozyma dairenensis CBS 421]|uniref:ATP synthase subunit n=1 Tax=Naumovozyma dairenensis (strain ATCC 10597 / BCRC 20456 / CBS 421 / NBRC 0211 / NRRL Y-12639) TaxID=1071378 RepID=G0WEC0_NAUDC|nr:hypothetical protein NDAI_0G03540 [Naumovozyma dairenensis CBS 421]CCD26131.2 hypothetical protein NDAI_0G03540 [Naumovozyma dairenensis CBS 421]